MTDSPMPSDDLLTRIQQAIPDIFQFTKEAADLAVAHLQGKPVEVLRQEAREALAEAGDLLVALRAVPDWTDDALDMALDQILDQLYPLPKGGADA